MINFSPSFVSSPPNRSTSQSSSDAAPVQNSPFCPGSTISTPRKLSSPLRASSSFQTPSGRYMKQFHALIDHQREVHNEERALWHIERTELYEKITRLETALGRYQAISTSQISSPIDKGTSETSSTVWSNISTTGSRPTSNSTSSTRAGDEVWRGPKPERKPSRTFSDSSTTSTTNGKHNDRLPSIAEDTNPTSRKRPFDDATSGADAPKTSIHTSVLDVNLDGIRFRTSSLASEIHNRVMTPQSPSPCLSPSPPSPGTLAILKYLDPYLKDAGHTPLARGQLSSTMRMTPINAFGSVFGAEQERPPLESQVPERKNWRTRPPSERHDSYFPPPTEEDDNNNNKDDNGDSLDNEDDNADPALQEPLTLSPTGKAEDTRFLNELDTKLLQAARSYSGGGTGGGGGEENIGADDDDTGNEGQMASEGPVEKFGVAEEPKLRIKRSMNFGSQLGSGVGKGF